MPLILADRVRDTTTTTGTGTVTLSGTAPTGYQNFSVIGNGNTTYYTINAGSQWEVGIGTYSSTGPTLARNTVLESSNANALVNFAAGTKDVFVTYPSDEAVYQDGAVIAAGTAVLGVANGGTGVTSSTGSVSVVLSKSPTLETPILGAATATSIANGLGAVGTPSYTFTGDLNTGMWSPAADTIAFSEGGVEIMRINSAGNVGIGTTSPQQLLAVGNSTDQVGAGVSGAVTTLFFGTPSNMTGGIKRIAYDRTTGSMNFIGGSVASPSTQMSLDTNGNLGIGTSAPAQTLQVVNAGNYQFRLGAGSTFNYDLGRSGSDGLLYFYGNQSTFTGYVFGGVDGERMRITSAGNVGIGTTAPTGRLGVAVSGSRTIGTAWDASSVLIGSPGQFSGNLGMSFDTTNGATLESAAPGVASYPIRLVGLQAQVFTTGTERMRIASDGKILIGGGTINAALGDMVLSKQSSGTATFALESQGSWNATIAATSSGDMIFSNPAASERMRINASGNVSIGTTVGYAGYGTGRGLTLSNQSSLIFQNASNTWNSTTAGGAVTYFSDNNMYIDAKDSGSNVIFRVNGATERARIDASGNVLVGTTTGSAGVTAARLVVASEIASKGSAAGVFWEDRSGGVTPSANWYGWYATGGTNFLFNGSANIASINGTTGVYTALSDANKKRDFKASDIGLDAVLALKPTLYRFKSEPDNAPLTLGFLAQEVREHIPQAYVEEGEFVGLSDRPIVAALVRAVQELTARVAQLEATTPTITFEGN